MQKKWYSILLVIALMLEKKDTRIEMRQEENR